MSLPRALLTSLTAFSNGAACTPPNPTRPKERYHTQEAWVLQIAPLVFKWHQRIAYTCALFETLSFLVTLLPSSPLSPALTLATCPAAAVTHPGTLGAAWAGVRDVAWGVLSFLFRLLPFTFSTSTPATPFVSSFETATTSAGITSTLTSSLTTATVPTPPLRPTPLFLLGVLSILLGAYIRLDCFHTLGEMFTFDLTVHPKHRLVTERFYSFVRHPAYTGSLMLVFGLALSHLTRGSWLSECAFPLLDAPFPFPLFPSSSPFSPTSPFPSSLPSSSSSSLTPPPKYIPLLGIPSHKLRLILWALWWAWTLSVGVSRAEAEDAQMHLLFGEEWEKWSGRVGWWFLPGVL